MTETRPVLGPEPEPGDRPSPPVRRSRSRREQPGEPTAGAGVAAGGGWASPATAAAAVVALAVLSPLVVQQVRGEPADRTLRQVRVDEGLRNDHTPDAVPYAAVPPLGGPHDPAWLECGPYDAPVRDENAVHDLEHGTVWITYDPALADADVAALEGELPDNGLLSPYDGLPSPVVVTVWGRQLRLTGADDPRLPLFIAAFGDGHTSPEPFASCAGGLTPGDAAPPDSQPV